MLKRTFAGMALAALVAGCQPSGEDQTEVSTLDSDQARLSYGMGYNLGSRIKGELDLDVRSFAAGVRHGIGGDTRLMSDEEIAQTMHDFQQQEMARHEEQMAELGEKNLAESEAFLKENAEREGVVTTESGLQYRVLEEGDGPRPELSDVVKVHYEGRLIDGTPFDSSHERGEPVTFPVDGVIPGWVEALQAMPVGSRWELVIPSDLAYGPGGTGGPIGPNQALIFEVELLDIVDESAE